MHPTIALNLTLPTLLLLAACSDEGSNIDALESGVASTDCAQADLVLHNTSVYTSNENQWTAEAVASKDGRIVFVGSNPDAEKYMCDSARVIDLAGKTVFAGFTDSHQHLEGVGKRTKTLSLFGIATLRETVQTIGAGLQISPTATGFRDEVG